MDWTAISSIAQVIAALGAVGALIAFWKTANEAAKQSKYQLMPVVTIDGDLQLSDRQNNIWTASVILKNVGHGLAQNLTVGYKQGQYSEPLPPIPTAVYLEPGKEISVRGVVHANNIKEDLHNENLGEIFVNYFDTVRRGYRASIITHPGSGFRSYQNRELGTFEANERKFIIIYRKVTFKIRSLLNWASP